MDEHGSWQYFIMLACLANTLPLVSRHIGHKGTKLDNSINRCDWSEIDHQPISDCNLAPGSKT